MIPEKVRAVLEIHHLHPLEFEPGSTPTAELAAERIGIRVGQIAKSILLTGKDGRPRMIVLAGDRRLSSSKVKKLLGVKARMATAEETLAATGFPSGGVCPFGVSGMEIFVDQSLRAYDVIYPAAGTDASGVAMTFDQLAAITGARPCSVTDEER